MFVGSVLSKYRAGQVKGRNFNRRGAPDRWESSQFYSISKRSKYKCGGPTSIGGPSLGKS